MKLRGTDKKYIEKKSRIINKVWIMSLYVVSSCDNL